MYSDFFQCANDHISKKKKLCKRVPLIKHQCISACFYIEKKGIQFCSDETLRIKLISSVCYYNTSYAENSEPPK